MTDEPRSTVPVPENAVRDEPLAFGLSGTQLGVLSAAAMATLVVNLAPLPELLRVGLVVLVAGPIVLAAILSIGGEPAYRWLARAVRFRTTNRIWSTAVQSPDKPQLSDEGDTGGGSGTPMAMRTDPARTPDPDRPTQDTAAAGHVGPDLATAPARLRLVEPDVESIADDPPPAERPEPPGAPIPHVVAGLRVIAVTSFAGGVGKTTLAVELATLLAARARYRRLDGSEHALSVLALDAARLAPAVGLRLGLDPGSLARLPVVGGWTDRQLVEQVAVTTRDGPAVLALPPQLPLDGVEGWRFGATEAAAILDGADRAGHGLVIADLGAVHEEGHRHLIDQAALVLGIVRPTIESLPDVLRLAGYLRGLGMGRKLVIVANAADDDRDIRRLAADAEIPLLGRVPPSGSMREAADRGEPAWRLDPATAAALDPIAAAIWPLAGVAARTPVGVGAAVSRVRAALRGATR